MYTHDRGHSNSTSRTCHSVQMAPRTISHNDWLLHKWGRFCPAQHFAAITDTKPTKIICALGLNSNVHHTDTWNTLYGNIRPWPGTPPPPPRKNTHRHTTRTHVDTCRHERKGLISLALRFNKSGRVYSQAETRSSGSTSGGPREHHCIFNRVVWLFLSTYIWS